MKVIPIRPDVFPWDGRGPILSKWLTIDDLNFPFTFGEHENNQIVGAEYFCFEKESPLVNLPTDKVVFDTQSEDQRSWVIFHTTIALQVTQYDYHSRVHRRSTSATESSAVYLIENSEWKDQFSSSSNLNNWKHYVIEFYDSIVDALCDDIIFGTGKFNLEQAASSDPRFSVAYLRRSRFHEKRREFAKAIADLQKYAQIKNDEATYEYADKVTKRLEKSMIETKA